MHMKYKREGLFYDYATSKRCELPKVPTKVGLLIMNYVKWMTIKVYDS